MPVLTTASPKGGAGKTTAAAVLAMTFAARGARVTLIDADKNEPLVLWHGAKDRSIRVIGDVREDNFVSKLDAESAARDLVIVDLEGLATRTMSRAIMRSDLVLIPMQPSKLDAVQAAKMVSLIRQEEELLRDSIPFRILMTRTSDAVPTRATRKLLSELDRAGIPALRTHLNQREPFKAIFEHGCELRELDPKHYTGLPAALQNAEALADEITDLLRTLNQGMAA